MHCGWLRKCMVYCVVLGPFRMSKKSYCIAHANYKYLSFLPSENPRERKFHALTNNIFCILKVTSPRPNLHLYLALMNRSQYKANRGTCLNKNLSLLLAKFYAIFTPKNIFSLEGHWIYWTDFNDKVSLFSCFVLPLGRVCRIFLPFNSWFLV